MPFTEPKPAHPYPDYIHQLDGTRNEYLYQFFKLQTPNAESSDQADETSVQELQIIDVSQSEFAFRTFKPQLSGLVDTEFVQALENPTPGSSVRFLVYHHQSVLRMNRSYLNTMSTKVGLSPSFLEAHIALWASRNPKDTPTIIPITLPTNRKYLQIIYNSFCHFTAAFLEIEGLKTVVILVCYNEENVECDEDPPKVISESSLQKLSPEEISRIEQNPIDFLLSPIEASQQQLGTLSYQYSFEYEVDNYSAASTLNTRQHLRLEYRSLSATLENLKRFWKNERIDFGKLSRRWQDVIANYVQLIEEYNSIDIELRNHLQITQNMDAITETRRGLKQNETLKQLTIVAFIFIPLNFSCSFFSMNVKQLNESTMDIRYFFLGSFIARIIAWALSAAISALIKALTTAREDIALNGPIKVLPEYEPQEYVGDKLTPDTVSLSLVVREWVLFHSKGAMACARYWEQIRVELATEKGSYDPLGIASEVSLREILARIFHHARLRLRALVCRKSDASGTELTGSETAA
ncbi:hypothetical protein BDZ45DRAFT_746394 [Acephala macrosclerotiorum]|nr:hypothetical protein BDZ45DRAFT_746394 [Acephala macrosclerotiorum]